MFYSIVSEQCLTRFKHEELTFHIFFAISATSVDPER